MYSRRSVAAVVMASLSVVLLASVAHAQQESARATGESPNRAEIARALEIVKGDPNLGTERTIKRLHWKESTTPPGDHPWLRWIAGLFRWIEESARFLLWVALGVLAGLLVVYVVRFFRTHGVSLGGATFVAPTHVRDLDIRPESLPPDVGHAARLLWDRGDRRAALALLYRGMLSRLVHVHRIPIRDSSTEGDCLALAARHLTNERREYASRLVSVWQRFVYGGQDTQTAAVYVLCDGFASALDSAFAFDAMRPGNSA